MQKKTKQLLEKTSAPKVQKRRYFVVLVLLSAQGDRVCVSRIQDFFLWVWFCSWSVSLIVVFNMAFFFLISCSFFSRCGSRTGEPSGRSRGRVTPSSTPPPPSCPPTPSPPWQGSPPSPTPGLLILTQVGTNIGLHAAIPGQLNFLLQNNSRANFSDRVYSLKGQS